MKTNVSMPVLLLVGILMSSCTPTKILTSTFEGDTVGSQPNKTLPGDPAGDQIQYSNAVAGRMRVQNSTNAGQKALQMSQTPITGSPSGHDIWLTFKGVSANADKSVRYSWTGRHQNINQYSEQYTLVDISDGTVVMARLYFYGNGRITRVNNIVDGSGALVATVSPEVEHTVFVSVNRKAKTYGLTIIPAGSSAISANNLPFISYGNPLLYNTPYTPSISYRLDDGVNENRKYIIESVYITQ